MARCRIGRGCVLLCLSAKLLELVQGQREQQHGDVFRPSLLAMLESIELLLVEPEFAHSPDWTLAERNALKRVLPTVAQLVADNDCGSVARKLMARMSLP